MIPHFLFFPVQYTTLWRRGQQSPPPEFPRRRAAFCRLCGNYSVSYTHLKKGAAPGLRSRSLRFYGVCKGGYWAFHAMAMTASLYTEMCIRDRVAAPGLGAGVAGAHIHLDQHVVLGQHLGGLILAVGVVGGILAQDVYKRQLPTPSPLTPKRATPPM